jgi:hypothetical protein
MHASVAEFSMIVDQRRKTDISRHTRAYGLKPLDDRLCVRHE